jgi:hypothetical protein
LIHREDGKTEKYGEKNAFFHESPTPTGWRTRRHRIASRVPERMTPRDATHGERDTTANAVFGQRLNGIFRAARIETARTAEK